MIYSCYAVIPGLIPMVVPLYTVVHIFAFIGMFFFHGLLNASTDFGDGPGKDPYYGILDFSSYSNSLIIMVNLLVVNNWVKMGSGLSNATGGLWTYVYFILFFVIGVTFCLQSLTSIFIGSIMIDQSTNPVTKNVSNHEKHVVFPADGRKTIPKVLKDYDVSLRHRDVDKLFSIIDTVSVLLLLHL